MCEFNHDGSELLNLKRSEALIGSRFFTYDLKTNTLRSLYREFFYTKKITTGDKPNLNDRLGIYSYGEDYNYYNYNYYNYNYYNYYYNYNYYNYNLGAIIKVYGQTVNHLHIGYRSQKIEIVALLSLKDHKDADFLKSFNSKVEQASKQFGIKTVPYQFGDGFPGNLL